MVLAQIVRGDAKVAAFEVAKPRWVFFALPFRLLVPYGISNFIVNGIRAVSPFCGKIGRIYTNGCCVSVCVLAEDGSDPPSY